MTLLIDSDIDEAAAFLKFCEDQGHEAAIFQGSNSSLLMTEAEQELSHELWGKYCEALSR